MMFMRPHHLTVDDSLDSHCLSPVLYAVPPFYQLNNCP